MTSLHHPARPCAECPWRRDQPAGRFDAERFEALRDTSGSRSGGSAPLGSPLFACHKTHEGAEVACAGWLAIEGANHVGVRYAASMGRLDPAALLPGKDWPELYDSYDEMAAVNGVTEGEPIMMCAPAPRHTIVVADAANLRPSMSIVAFIRGEWREAAVMNQHRKGTAVVEVGYHLEDPLKRRFEAVSLERIRILVAGLCSRCAEPVECEHGHPDNAMVDAKGPHRHGKAWRLVRED